MKKNERLKSKRIDYEVFNSTGERVVKNQSSININKLSGLLSEISIEDNKMSSEPDKITNQLTIDESTITEDICDFIDENSINDICNSNEELNEAISKIEEMRSKYRSKHKELQLNLSENYEAKFSKVYQNTMSIIKHYIKEAKDIKRKTENDELKINERSMMFLIENTKQQIKDLKLEFTKNINNAKDQDVIRWKAELPGHIKKFDRTAEKYQEVLKFTTNNEDIIFAVDDIGKSYEKLNHLKSTFVSCMNKESSERELSKVDLFQESRLNIKLSKFSGYDSTTDIYSFQSEFEKLHLRTTPNRVLPDLLKNNYLTEPALSLVKGVDDINEIWERLKIAYGDTKIMLIKKLNDVKKLEALTKMKDPEKIIAGLSRIINVTKDLIKLSKKHNIEKRLYYGDGLERIYNLMGDNRVTRWLSASCEQDLEEEQLWLKLVLFLEKVIKVQQQKVLIQGSKTEHKEKSVVSEKTSRYKSYFSPTFTEGEIKDTVCYICGGIDHVATAGPGGIKVIQYFSCKMFVEKTPAERFAILREKGFCFQCLLPGADGSQGKHKEGKCQHDYTCQHPMHKKYPRKKHVLVCDEHKMSNENKELLEKYKYRCILKNSTLLSFSRDIRLTFHVAAYQNIKEIIRNDVQNDEPVIADIGIYLLQKVTINNKCFTIFYDSGCGDFIVKHDAIQYMGSHAIQEHPGPINLGGIGDIHTQSLHGIYSVTIPLCNGKSAILSGVCLDKITATFPDYPLKQIENEIHNAYAATVVMLNVFLKYRNLLEVM